MPTQTKLDQPTPDHSMPDQTNPFHATPSHSRPYTEGRVPDSFYAEAIRLIREVKAIRRL